MQDFKNQIFRDQIVHIDGGRFTDCEFHNCTITYSGGEEPQLYNCKFVGEKFRFEDAAMRTLSLLKAFASNGSGMQNIVRGAFPDLFRRS